MENRDLVAVAELEFIPRPSLKLMAIPPIVILAACISSVTALLLDPLMLDGNVAVAALSGGVFSVLLWCLNRWWERRRERKQDLADAIDTTVDERRMLMDEYARLRREERAHTESLVAGYARIAETSRQRSHIIANGYMQFQFAHQQLLELLQKQDIEVPESLHLRQATASILLQLEGVTQAENPIA